MILSKKIEYTGKCWPSKKQQLLLDASLFSGEKPLNSWRKWTGSIDLNEIDPGSYRLLPLAVHNLVREGVNDPFIRKFKGLKKKTWLKNQILLKTLKDVLTLFHNHGIKTMVLKGAALIPLYFKDLSIRPQNDVDILVYPESALTAVKILNDSGWRIKGKFKRKITKETLNVRNSLNFENGTVSSVDLHWHALAECIDPGADRDFWKHAQSLEIDGIKTHVMSHEDQLYLTCVHALRHQPQWEPLSSVNWIADCMYILRESVHKIDFNRMRDQARSHSLILPLRISMNYLRQQYAAAIPLGFIRRLRDTAITRIEYNEFMIRQKSSLITGPFLLRCCTYLRSIRKEKSLSFFNKIWRFTEFHKAHAGVPSAGLLPVLLFCRGIKRIKTQLEKKIRNIPGSQRLGDLSR